MYLGNVVRAREDEELAVASNLVSGDGPEVLQAERAPWRLLVGRCEDLDAGQRDGVVLGHCGMNGIIDEIIAARTKTQSLEEGGCKVHGTVPSCHSGGWSC